MNLSLYITYDMKTMNTLFFANLDELRIAGVSILDDPEFFKTDC